MNMQALKRQYPVDNNSLNLV